MGLGLRLELGLGLGVGTNLFSYNFYNIYRFLGFFYKNYHAFSYNFYNIYRCLGLFYKNCHESLLPLFASTLTSKEIFGLILEGLSTASVKVCWNVCACIQNMIQSQNCLNRGEIK